MAVQNGTCQSGLQHYNEFGIGEGRRTTRWSKQLHFIRDYNEHVKGLIVLHPGDLDLAMAKAIGSPTLESYLHHGDLQYYMLQHYGLFENCSLYDLACGSGRTAQALERFGWTGSYIGSDVIKELVDYAQLRQPSYSFYLHYDYSLRADPCSAHFVYAWSLFTHLLPEESYLYIRDSLRVLVRGGKLIFGFLEASQEGHWSIFSSRVGQLAVGESPPHLDYFWDRAMIAKISRELGFSSIEFIDSDDQNATPIGAFGQSIAVLTK